MGQQIVTESYNWKCWNSERAAIVIGKIFQQLLVGPVTQDATAKEMVQIIIQKFWYDHIIVLSFDTTTSSAGLNHEACMNFIMASLLPLYPQVDLEDKSSKSVFIYNQVVLEYQDL